MNKVLLFLLLMMTIISISMGCASGTKTAKDNSLTLDQSIKIASEEIDSRLEAGTKIALLNFSSSVEQFSTYVIDELTANLVNSRHLIIIDRQEIDLRREELNFQMSGEVDDDSMQSLGRTLGAQSIISGSLTIIGSEYRIVIRVLNVQTGTVEVQYRADIVNDRRVTSLLDNNRSSSIAITPTQKNSFNSSTIPSETIITSAQSRHITIPSPTTIYEIGDAGPAGGIVFYDKGEYTNNWRYLEYAPDNFRSVYWGPYGLYITGTETGIGFGKANTDLIVKVLNRRGEKRMAAQLCNEFILNGYNDWFLPSKDELNLMYNYLKANLLLESRFGFYGWFYSSSQYDNSDAWGHNFTNGYQGNYRKNISGGYVRAIRSF